MNKPVWVSFVGWLFVGLMGFALGVPFVNVIIHQRAVGSMAAGFALLLCFPTFCLWVLGTIVHRFRARGAALQAAAITQAMQKAGWRPPEQNTSGPRPVVTSPLDRTGTAPR